MNKHDEHTTYVYCGPGYIDWGALLLLLRISMIFGAHAFLALFSPVLLYPLYKLNNRNDGTPNRSFKEMFDAHPTQRIFCIAACVCFAAFVVLYLSLQSVAAVEPSYMHPELNFMFLCSVIATLVTGAFPVFFVKQALKKK